MMEMYSRVWSSHQAKRGLTLPVVPQVGNYAHIKADFLLHDPVSVSVDSVLYMF